MKITRVKTWLENLHLNKPYTIAYRTIQSVENVFVYLETADGVWGIGAGSPGEYVTGESVASCRAALTEHAEDSLLGQDIRHYRALLRSLEHIMPNAPAARAAVDIALHDAVAKAWGVPLATLLGQQHRSLPTSITIGIQEPEEAIREARERIEQGFRRLKVKIGKSLDLDVETLHRLREGFGEQVRIRVDANQGYSPEDLRCFVRQTEALQLEFIEQPLKAEYVDGMFEVPEEIRRGCVADESLIDPADALWLAHQPQPFGIFNIKLMKCGGIAPALQIAEIAALSNIDLMWGCMDESRVSIAAALHAAFACSATKYLDLDGSLDLARDIVGGGFVLRDGNLSVSSESGLGVRLVEAIE